MTKVLCCLLFLPFFWISSCTPEVDIDIASNFTFTVADTVGVRANSQATISLLLASAVETEKGTIVTFETNKGTLVSSDVPLENKQAIGYLKVAAEPGRYIIKASIKQGGTVKVQKQLTFVLKEPIIASRFTFQVADTLGICADGQALMRITLSKPIDLIEGATASFSTNNGVLLTNDIPFVGSSAFTFLRVGSTPSYYFLGAIAKDGTIVRTDKRLTIYLKAALADSIALDTDLPVFKIKTSAPTTLRTFLSRRSGIVSPGASVAFRVFQLNTLGAQNSVGRLIGLNGNVSTAAQQLADIKLYCDTGNVDTTKAVFVEAQTRRDNGTLAIKRIALNYQR